MGRNLAGSIGVLCVIALICVSFTSMVNAATSVTLSSPAQTETTISLSWTGSNDILFSSYTVYMSTNGVNGNFTNIWSTTNKGQTSTFVYGLVPNTSYYFYVTDSGTLVGTSPSNYIQATTNSNPVLSNTAQTTSTVSLQWTDYNSYSTLVPFDNYVIQMSTSGSNGPWSTLTTVTQSSQNTYTVTGLNSGKYYFIMYDTVGSTGYTQTSYSNAISVTISPPVTVSIPNTNLPSVIDMGQTAQISSSANGGGGTYAYQWYVNQNQVSGAISSTYVFSPTATGTYSIKVIASDALNPSNQASSAPITITVNSQPSVSISPVTSVTDVGQQIQFTSTASGGTGSYTYQWYSNGNAQASATFSSFTFNPSVAGSYTITLVIHDASTPSDVATSNSAQVTVSNPPTPTPTPTPISTPTSTLTSTPTATATPTSSPTPTIPELTPLIVLIVLAIATCSAISAKIVKQKSLKSNNSSTAI